MIVSIKTLIKFVFYFPVIFILWIYFIYLFLGIKKEHRTYETMEQKMRISFNVFKNYNELFYNMVWIFWICVALYFTKL